MIDFTGPAALHSNYLGRINRADFFNNLFIGFNVMVLFVFELPSMPFDEHQASAVLNKLFLDSESSWTFKFQTNCSC